MTQTDLHQPIDHPKLTDKIERFFDVGSVRDVSHLSGGYMSQNLRVDTDRGSFFLKQYRNRISTVVYEIKFAERYFAEQGIPVITPVPDRFGRPAFWLGGTWYSLFPFVGGTVPAFGSLTGHTCASLGDMLGRVHVVGRRAPASHHRLRLWSKEGFRMELVELEEELRGRPALSDVERTILDVLHLKSSFVEANERRPEDFDLPFDCLLHGDFIYQNTYVDGAGNVERVFDLEKSCVGPAAYELARSMLISCFDNGWGEEQTRLAKAFLRAYRRHVPTSRDELLRGMQLYAINLFHMTWIEARHVLYHNDASMPIYERHAARVRALGGDLSSLCDRICE